ncbi:histidine kinase [Lysinibacillus contaminans]|uniref:histidine kinase n=1 Tax=Lysinibacillus contaminans TaxID=1293441 RepID=A0ABR5K385_9BACI|nr:HAMP domain-containing sensor histidine kinase [Lysinibacillus contaminans]KOS69233.1 histidine kinase [Lysinibacillus contaminans]
MYVKDWLRKWLLAAIVCLLLMLGCISYLFFNSLDSDAESKTPYAINQTRLQVNDLQLYIEKHYKSLEQDLHLQNSLQTMSNDQKIGVLVVQLDGRVIFNSTNVDSPSYIQIKNDLHYDVSASKVEPEFYKISFPIIDEKTQNQIGNAIFTLHKDMILPEKPDTSNNNLIMLVISLLSIILIILFCIIVNKSKKDVLIPISNLKTSTEEILKGNYGQKNDFVKNDEIGELYAVFEQMRIEIMNLDKQRLEQDQNQKKLVSSISHDIKTPLTTVKAYLDAIAEGICPDMESLMAYINVMQTNTEKMSRLLDDLLIHSLKELGHIPVTLKEQYSKKVLTNIIHPISHYVQTTGIHFIAPTEIPNVLIQVDEHRLEQVIANLITNSLKHTSYGDSITISITVEQQTLKIIVSDTGKGMLPQDMPFIFERYFRGAHPTDETIIKNEGAGLGLSICKHIMEAHNGSISFKSKQNEGTTFTLLLPIC